MNLHNHSKEYMDNQIKVGQDRLQDLIQLGLILMKNSKSSNIKLLDEEMMLFPLISYHIMIIFYFQLISVLKTLKS
jgi:hypothetical protein